MEVLVTATYDRAILLTEITRVVMTHHLKVPDGELDIISRVQSVILIECEAEPQSQGATCQSSGSVTPLPALTQTWRLFALLCGRGLNC